MATRAYNYSDMPILARLYGASCALGVLAGSLAWLYMAYNVWSQTDAVMVFFFCVLPGLVYLWLSKLHPWFGFPAAYLFLTIAATYGSHVPGLNTVASSVGLPQVADFGDGSTVAEKRLYDYLRSQPECQNVHSMPANATWTEISASLTVYYTELWEQAQVDPHQNGKYWTKDDVLKASVDWFSFHTASDGKPPVPVVPSEVANWLRTTNVQPSSL